MNREQLRAFLWLRWRLRVNQVKRAGTVNAVLLAVLAGCAVFVSVFAFVIFLVFGANLLARCTPAVLLYVWDGLIAGFVFFWLTGLLTDLQRSEVLSLDKFLHLPVSLGGAFLINYVSSLVCMSLIIFLPAMVGLAFGLTIGRGPALLVTWALVFGFVFAVTALTHQFQGWLAALMTNPRRRRTVIAVVTIALVLVLQLPNLINVMRPWQGGQNDDLEPRFQRELVEAKNSWQRERLRPEQIQKAQQELQKRHQEEREAANRERFARIEETARFVNLVLPPGWVPLGVATAAEGNVLPGLLAALGFTAVGAASLWRSYRTTVRLYRGEFSGDKRRPATVAAPARPESAGVKPANWLEQDVPWVSEHAAVVALAGFRSLVRAPEAKMLLLSPLLISIVFGTMLLRRAVQPPEMLRPLMATGAMATVLLGMIQLVGNQFGFDRNGFRVFVLCAAPRREILLGKNLAVAPFALGLAVLFLLVFQALYPLRVEHFLATFPQLVTLYLLFCMVANTLSIAAPMPIAAGSLKPANPRALPILLQFGFILLLPVVVGASLLPLGVEALLESAGVMVGMPTCLVLALLECSVVVLLYRLVLTWQGTWLQARERRILELVTAKAE